MKKKTEAKGKSTKKPAAKKAAPKKAAVKKPAKKNEKELEEAEANKLSRVVAKKTGTRKAAVKRAAQRSDASGLNLAKLVAQGMYEKKAEDIRILDMRGLPGASADFFVLCHAASDKQVEAIADSAEEEVQKHTGEWPWHREGYENLEWILLDYFDVVAHIFQQEKREFYAVEDLWGDAKDVPFKGK